jgi:hypothetical protein
VSSDDYFAIVLRMKTYMVARGFELDEFGDTDEADRRAVRDQVKIIDFEGQVVYPPSDAWRTLLPAFAGGSCDRLPRESLASYSAGVVLQRFASVDQ